MTNWDLYSPLKQIWGYDQLRPLQEEAINLALDGRDSLVVMPTGGGKSLCFQLPPLIDGGLTLVISPLISLMQDQVDALRLVGYPAEAFHSNLTPAQSARVTERLANGELKLLYLSPERLFAGSTLSMLRQANQGQGVRRIAIDEAHCISQWGHDFRPEYRQLKQLRTLFPGSSIQALTATATPRVRDDILRQLSLQDPTVLVGTFDRPNLTYRVVPKVDAVLQAAEAIKRHPHDGAIVYCLSRKDTEAMHTRLVAEGIRATVYHAGLSAQERQKASEEFARERVNVVVATVAFGMGIDRSNVRVVVHESLPMSIEGYQQETGRAGRDGLPSECLMLYSPGDVVRRERLLQDSAPEILNHRMEMLHEVRSFAMSTQCRHAYLTEYFGQEYPDAGKCNACDLCLEGWKAVPESTNKAHMILAVVRNLDRQHQNFGFGATHIAQILAGADRQNIRKYNHQELRGYGALSTATASTISGWINQLADQGLLVRTKEQFPSVHLSEEGAQALDSRAEVALRDLVAPEISGGPKLPASYSGELFEALRALRREISQEREVAAFIIFGDAALIRMASQRPTTTEAFQAISGVGERKAQDLGPRFLAVIREFSAERSLPTDLPDSGERISPAPKKPVSTAKGATRSRLVPLFERGATWDEIVSETGLAYSTVTNYQAEWIEETQPDSISAWVDEETYQRVASVVEKLGSSPMRPIFEALNGDIDYNVIRVVIAHLLAQHAQN